MIWSFRNAFLFVFIAISIATLGGAPQNVDAATGAQGCEIIDSNWEEYGENIRGANTKVSDVVLNACKAIGGGDSCTFISGCRYNEGDANQDNPICTRNGGATNSQHRQSKAIDVTVPAGKEKEFMTMAICGLRRVNKCEGGMGLYSGGSIHVDVRQGRGIWSDDYTNESIPTKVKDPAARAILYSFGAGECAPGSISSDYSEEKEYGPVEEYTPPKGYSDEFKAIIQPPSKGEYTSIIKALNEDKYTPKNYFESLYQPISGIPIPNLFNQNSSDSTSDTPNKTSQVFSDDLIYIDSEQVDDTSTSGGSLLDFITGSKNEEDTPKNVLEFDTPKSEPTQTNEVSCEGSGFLGTNFFKKCDTQQAATQTDVSTQDSGSVVSTLMHNITKLTGSSSNDTAYTTNSETTSAIQKTIASDNSFDGFYATHIPNDGTANVQQTPDGQTDNNNYAQFVVGGQETVAPERVSSTPGKAVRFAEQSVLYGTYYGVAHAISPLLIGSTPRSLLRMTDGNDFTRVHNLFSI